MNYPDFEAWIRASMNDVTLSDETAIWQIVDVIAATNAAIRDYSQNLPRERSATLTVVAGQREYDLPEDILSPPATAIVALYWQRVGYERDYLKLVDMQSGRTERISVSGTGKGFSIWGDQLILEDAPVSSDAEYPIYLRYRGLHALVPSDDDDRELFTFSIPEADMNLIYWYAGSLLMAKLEADDSYLRQYAGREDLGIRRDDSPVLKSADWRMKQYQEGMRLRLGRKVSVRLVRSRR
jgi:hypothetical protein